MTEPLSDRFKLITAFLFTASIITIFQVYLAGFVFRQSDIFWYTGSSSYSILAESWLKSGQYSLNGQTPTAYRPPLYPMFLASFLRWTDDAWPIIIGQSLIAGLSLGLLATIDYFYSSKLWSIAVITILYAFIGEIALEYLVQRETGLFSLLLIVSAAIFIIEEL